MNAQAMIRTSVEMYAGLIDKGRALTPIRPVVPKQLPVPMLEPRHGARALAQGLPASPGAASGRVIFDATSHVPRRDCRSPDWAPPRQGFLNESLAKGCSTRFG